MATVSGSEHISRYRAVAEFDSLVRAAREARNELRKLREEEAKANKESIEEDKKVAASRKERSKAEVQAAKESRTEAQKAQVKSTSKVIEESIDEVRKAYRKAGDESADNFNIAVKERFRRDKDGIVKSVGFDYAIREYVRKYGQAGEESGESFIKGVSNRITRLNKTLKGIGIETLDLNVDTDSAIADIKELEAELTLLSHETAEPKVRIDTNRALTDLRAIKKLFKDEVAEEIIKDSARIRKELELVDKLPSGKSFKFWSATALADMARVFEQARKGATIFETLREAIASAGGGGKGGNVIRTLIGGFDDLSEGTSKVLQRLSRVSGELYRMPGLIAVAVAAIPALVSGIGALAGGALGLSSGLGAVSGILAALPGVASALVGTIGALSATFGDLGDVLKEAKKAQTEELYEQERVRLGTEKSLTPLQKYTALINAMLPATQDVTLAIVDFADAWTNVSERVGENFYKQVLGDIENLAQILPIAENFLGKSATALGKVADEGIRMVTSGPWKKDFATLADANATVIENFGKAGLDLAAAFKDIAIAAIPFTTWITSSIRDGAQAFADWSAQAREDGTIKDFLIETTESSQSLWQILKNLGNVVNSFFQSTVDEGQNYLKTLEDITGGWADVAKAQEQANSPLREWMVQIRPILSSLGDLVAALSAGIADLASDQQSVQAMVDLLDSLRKDVLPPILSILQHLNDSGIAVTVIQALGGILEAISTFLNSGATTALSVFVTVLAGFFELIANIASLPGISHVLGALATGIAAIAAVSVVARFTGLFKLWDFLTWITRNRGNLSGAFTDVARGVAGLPTTGQTAPAITNIPSTIGGVGSEAIGKQATAIGNVGNAAQTANTKVSAFSRTMLALRNAGTGVQSALGNLVGFLGGPWGVALTVATVGATLLFTALSNQKQEATDTANALLILKDAYGELKSGNTDTVAGLAASNEKVKELIDSSKRYGIAITDVAGTLNNNEQATARFVAQIDEQIAAQERAIAARKEARKGETGIDLFLMNDEKALEATRKYREEIVNTANAEKDRNEILKEGSSAARTYQDRLAGMTQAQVDSAVAATDMNSKIQLLSGAMDTLSDSTKTSSDRASALSAVIDYFKGPAERAIEATENWESNLLNLSEAAEANGRSLQINSREGLRNRDALQAAAKATRELYLEDIAAGVPMDEALERHKERIKELEKEAKKTFDNKKTVRELIDTYGEIPESIKTDIQTDEKGFAAVFAELKKLQIIQTALQEGKTMAQAEKDWRNAQNGLYERYIPNRTGDGYGVAKGYATGGAVWGAGTKTSDSIRAWLSNGEFVQPADSVDYYGMDVMEALRRKTLDRSTIFEALPDTNNTSFASGGSVHSDNCMACQSGGHKFATGGQVRVPIVVNPKNTLINKDWGTQFAGSLGNGGGGKGWQWQMKVLREAFPGLPLISGYRPGARTLSGNPSYHGVGRAVDLPPRRDVAQWIRSNYGAQTKELITPFNDLNLHNGKPHRYTGAIWNQHNFAGGNAHDHWAFNQGGLVDLMQMMNGLQPNTNSSLPSTPRSLSSAASSVVNNSTDSARTFGDVIINNPMPERAGDSIRDALYRTTLLY